MNIRLIAAIAWLLVPTSSIASERISSFHSAIAIRTDGSMSVTETITVVSAGEQIRHGIFRDFPTSYTGDWGTHYNIRFSLQKITRDTNPEPYQIKEHHNGVTIIIGDRDMILSPGMHTYSLMYTTKRQLGFFESHDELYWNVTGNGWRLPIDKVTATVTLPQQLDPHKIHVEAYTGPQGAKGTAYAAQVTADGVAQFATTAPLGVREGLTIVVTWPKGSIPPPTAWMNFWYFVQDNYQLLIMLFLLMLWFVLYLALLIKVRKTRNFGTIIPLFTPPTSMSAAEVYYVARGHLLAQPTKLLSIATVQAAVEGFLTISYEPQFLSKRYTLVQKKQPESATSSRTPSASTALVLKIFATNERIELSEKERPTVAKTISQLTFFVSQAYDHCFSTRYLFLGGISLIALALINLFLLTPWFSWGILPLLLLLFPLIRSYTPAGRKIMQEIEGFKLFLATTETERLQIIGTPPTRTPELYETYLPYAMALGVEKQWTKQFTPVFAKLQAEGHPYTPVWFMGAPFTVETMPAFASSLQNSLSSSISSSTTMPGSSSGSGGGGSSGGGGGGGGGGGW